MKTLLVLVLLAAFAVPAQAQDRYYPKSDSLWVYPTYFANHTVTLPQSLSSRILYIAIPSGTGTLGFCFGNDTTRTRIIRLRSADAPDKYPIHLQSAKVLKFKKMEASDSLLVIWNIP